LILRKENKGASINKENNSNENNLNINSNKKNGKILNFTIEKKYKDKIIDEKNYKNFKNEISNLDILKKNLEYSEKDKNKIKENELNNYKNLKTNNFYLNNSLQKISDFKKLNNETSIFTNLSDNLTTSRKNNIRKLSKNGENLSNKGICCDEIFYEYLKNISNLANKSYFLFAFKFILIFRECINTYKNIELQNSIIVLKENIPDHIREFTQYYDAEQAPEMCNEFITDYLNHCDFFGFDKIELPEIIDIVQHFCYWMFENNYTSSRLSLLNL